MLRRFARRAILVAASRLVTARAGAGASTVMGGREGRRSGCTDESVGARVRKATDGASATVFIRPAALIGGLLIRSRTAAVADCSSAQRIGRGDRGCPRCAYWCKDLHQ